MGFPVPESGGTYGGTPCQISQPSSSLTCAFCLVRICRHVYFLTASSIYLDLSAYKTAASISGSCGFVPVHRAYHWVFGVVLG